MAGNTSEEPFLKTRSTSEKGDPFESMREQMEKERDDFFRGSNPREWQNEPKMQRHGGFFNRPRTSFSGFPNSSNTVGPGIRRPRYVNNGPEDWDGFGAMTGGPDSSGLSHPAFTSNSLGRPRKQSEERDEQKNITKVNPVPQQEGSVPISVHHTLTSGTQPKYRYGHQGQGGRNTTELPAKATTGESSPRLERASSEPPNKFNQRLNRAKPQYTSIPENSEGSVQGNNSSAQHLDPGQNPIKTTASAPSVPSRGQQSGRGVSEYQPVPPPRRSPPRPISQSQAAQPTNSSANVRHIPIFVEGRPEPIFNPNVNAPIISTQDNINQTHNTHSDSAFPKPSDYYPPGVQRLKSRDGTSTPDTPRFKHEGPFNGQNQVTIPVQEPTTPQGPPPGPIPMGFTPVPDSLVPHQVNEEPTTPQGPPPGPIPMGYLPPKIEVIEEPTNLIPPPFDPNPFPYVTSRTLNDISNDGSNSSDSYNKVIDTKPDENDIKPQAETNISKDQDKIGTVHSDDNKKFNNVKVPKVDPVVNVIPIKVEHGRPESPRPQLNLQNQNQKAGESPTPQPEFKTKKDPKIAKLDKIKGDVELLLGKIETFCGNKQDKEYLYLDEMLTRHLIALDGVEPDGKEEIRTLRKDSIKSVNRCLSLLDRKVSSEDNGEILAELATRSEEEKPSGENNS